MRYAWLLVSLCFVAPALAQEIPETAPVEEEQPYYYPESYTRNTYGGVLLQGLNKVTARASKLEILLGEYVRFGKIEIEVLKCWQSPPEDLPETAALLRVTDYKSEEPVLMFQGWMFASSPALSSLEHPVYDLRILSCVNPQ
jgi:hypothetical protein